MGVASSAAGEFGDSQYICACTFTSVGVEIGICITSRRACSSVLGLRLILWIARRRLGKVMRPSATSAARIAIVVLSPRDTALLALRFVDGSKRGDRARHAVRQRRTHLIQRIAVRQGHARYLDGRRWSRDRSQLPDRGHGGRFRGSMKTL